MDKTAVEIQSVIKKINSLKKAEVHFKQLTENLAQDRQYLSELTLAMDKELKDIENLENMSVRGLFIKVLGNRETELERERQEYLAVALKVKELKKNIELHEFEIGILKSKVEELESLNAKLTHLKEQREDEILRLNLPQKVALQSIMLEEDLNSKMIGEIEEAQEVGRSALVHLENVLKHIKQAEKWGNWDMYHGKSKHYDNLKYAAIDHATQSAIEARNQLMKFQRELADVGHHHKYVELKIDTFTNFTDVFFDNLISDWIVQRKIKSVVANVEAALDKVTMLLKTLDADFVKCKALISQLKSKRDSLILRSIH